MKIINEIPPVLGKEVTVALDIEVFGMTRGKLHRPHGTFACLSLCYDGKNVHQIYDESQIKGTLKNINKATWVFHNALFDVRQLQRYATINPRFIWDTMLVEQCMNGGLYQNYGLKDLSRRWLGEYMDKEAQGEFEGADVMSTDMKIYAAKDAIATWKIAQLQAKKYKDTPAFRVYEKIDEPMIWPLLEMPGIRVDAKKWEETVKEFEKKSHELEDELGINVMSQLQVINGAKKYGIHLQNTQAATLEAFREFEFIDKVLVTRMYRKAVSTYGMSWLEKFVEPDGKVYSSYHIDGAETGRMSASDPNNQQIPQRKLPVYRSLFIASSNSNIMVSDVHQQEPTILAYESKDQTLIDAIKKGEDIHLTVARAIFNDPKMKADDPRRFIGKTINLGTSYGLSEYGLATRINVSEDEAARFLKNYFSRFNGVFSWISLQRNNGYKNGYVKTASGRRIYLNLYQNQWSNNAINAPIQGGAADFTKVWMRKMWEKCREAGIPFFVVAIVHDEIVQDVLKELVKETKKILNDSFQETAAQLYPGIPFSVETEMGRSWACKQIKSELVEEDE